jgi:hypothetical protein
VMGCPSSILFPSPRIWKGNVLLLLLLDALQILLYDVLLG